MDWSYRYETPLTAPPATGDYRLVGRRRRHNFPRFNAQVRGQRGTLTASGRVPVLASCRPGGRPPPRARHPAFAAAIMPVLSSKRRKCTAEVFSSFSRSRSSSAMANTGSKPSTRTQTRSSTPLSLVEHGPALFLVRVLDLHRDLEVAACRGQAVRRTQVRAGYRLLRRFSRHGAFPESGSGSEVRSRRSTECARPGLDATKLLLRHHLRRAWNERAFA
jgi:hypothetical protein